MFNFHFLFQSGNWKMNMYAHFSFVNFQAEKVKIEHGF